MSLRQTITGLQEAQAANLELLAALRPEGALGRAVQFTLAASHRLATTETVVDSGAWRAAHRVQQDGLKGELYLDPGARNPRNGAPVSVYARANARRSGGRYDVYRVVADQHQAIAEAAVDGFLKELPQ